MWSFFFLSSTFAYLLLFAKHTLSISFHKFRTENHWEIFCKEGFAKIHFYFIFDCSYCFFFEFIFAILAHGNCPIDACVVSYSMVCILNWRARIDCMCECVCVL